ncbi:MULTISPECIES: electron transfer flavoprotein-ubiquinone oxidoreductase [unclassified Bartonella]|uniref:electron transfer flavoprotein-ubiquinone oxidoreductase n=1 Tax=unclassified Bartonella TaxID=2645622 RepID=UPI0009990114|nr:MULTISPECIES: electron transfer flavoprotein-ubiquinone oxidoreductase [unclassified Bartonella]AQX27557.1 electron-transferring-flavoprotein dehydrogenase [Bartonella sp. JB15]AQX28837.1 electron-transferring-flavoprotein dehydrogenase [Bartonella sp. JB63]
MNADIHTQRETIECDIVIVGGGPAGLSAAIRLKQINPDFSIIILEKSTEIGAHILSGAVIDPIGINKLLPEWSNEQNHPFQTPVISDQLFLLTSKKAQIFPNILRPPILSNNGCYIVSLGNVCRWLSKKAEELGVEIYPGFPVSDILCNDYGAVIGVLTGDMGVEKNGTPGKNYIPGTALLAKYTLIAEGARGSIAKQLIKKFNLSKDREPQKFGLGLKELWKIDPQKHKLGLIQHFTGWPLDNYTGGGGFLYHQEDNLISVGFVVHLDYKNPYLSPFEEFQRFKTHPKLYELFKGAKRLAYGARTISEGGWQSVPKLTFPGGVLIGCSAGFVNVPRIKGSHNAILSGILAAEKIATALSQGRAHDEVTEIEDQWRKGPIGKDLYTVRNVKPLWAKYGTKYGIKLAGFDLWWQQFFRFSLFRTLPHRKEDYACLEPEAKFYPITYPKPDGIITFDRLSSVALSNTHHETNQPCHLKIISIEKQKSSEYAIYGGPSARYCPAAVYEWLKHDDHETYIINASNCIHCKTCDIKDPNQNIHWICPQGNEGPVYQNM